MKRTVVLTGIMGILVACSSSSSGSGSVTVANAPDQFAAAACDKLASCGALFISVSYGDAATCKARQALGIKADLAAPGVTVTDAQLSACLDAYKALSCDDLLGGGARASACEFKGSVAAGAACGTGPQCVTGSCYKGTGDCGKCTARAASGGDCSAAECESGLYCNAAKKCAAYAKAGEACSADTRCGGRTNCVSGKCAAPLAENADCDLKSEAGCDALAGLSCIPSTPTATTGKCTKATTASAGQECGYVSGKIVLCGNATYCAGSAPPTTPGKCTALPKEPDDCSTTKQCLSPAKCSTTTKKCEIFDPATCK
jgi:hypothetical protein